MNDSLFPDVLRLDRLRFSGFSPGFSRVFDCRVLLACNKLPEILGFSPNEFFARRTRQSAGAGWDLESSAFLIADGRLKTFARGRKSLMHRRIGCELGRNDQSRGALLADLGACRRCSEINGGLPLRSRLAAAGQEPLSDILTVKDRSP